MASVRRFRADEWPRYRDLRLRALAESPDAFSTVLETQHQRPDGYWAERLAAGATSAREVALVAEEGDAMVGLVWGVLDRAAPETAHVLQMWVAPQHRGHGTGALLLDAVVAWARDAGARSVRLSVTCGNTPAGRLYTHAGFRPAGDPEPLRPGSGLRVQPMRLDLGA